MKKQVFIILLLFLTFSVTKLASQTEKRTLTELEDLVKKHLREPQVAFYMETLLNRSIEKDSLDICARTLTNLLSFYYEHNDSDRFTYWIDHIDSLALANKLNNLYYDAHRAHAVYLLNGGNYQQAVSEAINIYNKAQKTNEIYGMISSSDILGMIYRSSQRDSAAILAFQDALSKLETLDKYLDYKIKLLTYLIESNLRLGNLKEAKLLLAKYESYLNQKDDEGQNLYTTNETNKFRWLMYSFYADLFLWEKQTEKANEALQMASSYYEDGLLLNKDFPSYYYPYVEARYYKETKQYDKAIAKIDSILKTAPELESMKLKLDILCEKKEFKEALELYKKIFQFLETANNDVLVRQINDLRILHDMNDQKIRDKKLQINNLQAKEKQRIFLYTSFASFILLVLLYILFQYLQKMKKYKNELEQDKNTLIISQSKLQEEKKKAEEANLIKNAFIANISHEIRTPLNAIVGFSTLLSEGEYDEENKKEFIDLINKNTGLLLNLINDVLDLSRLESGNFKLQFETFDISSCCHEALDSIRHKISPEVKLIYSSSFDTFRIDAPKQQIYQILCKLLDNAAKFTQSGEIDLTIEKDEINRIMTFSVTDTGAGIPEEKQAKIFDRFEKLDDYSQGTGLGLSICVAITEQIGGSIKIDSSYTTGARFIFTYPYRIAQQSMTQFITKNDELIVS